MRRNVMVAILALLMFGGGVFAGIDIQYCKDALKLAELEFQVDEWERYSRGWEDVADHYKFHLDRLCHDNEQAKDDIERLLDACDNLTRERDIYYAEVHRLLNPQDY